MLDRRQFLISTAAFGLALHPHFARAAAPTLGFVRGPEVDGVREEVLLLPTTSLVFGRGQGSDVLLVAKPGEAGLPRISRTHFQIELGRRAQIRDLASSNGTTLGGKRLGRRSKTLAHGVKIGVAEVLELDVEVIATADGNPLAVVLGDASGKGPRYAMVCGKVGLAPKSRGLLCPPEAGAATLDLREGGLVFGAREPSVEVEGTPLGKSTLTLSKPTSATLDTKVFALGLLDPADRLIKFLEPADPAHTFCGTPEY